MEITLYSTGCYYCKSLEKLLADHDIQYKKITDIDLMLDKGFTQAPMLEVDGRVMDYNEAIKWVKGRK